jgi:predicted metalloprotease
MKLDDSRRSDNVEDERGSSGGVGFRGAGIGIGTIVIVVIGYFMGVSPSTLLSLLNGGDTQAVDAPAPANPTGAAANDPQVDFVRAILGETEDVWGAYFQNMGKTYTAPKLVLFSGQIESACGFASAAAGPFYCPGDQKVYIDLSFYRQLATEFGAPGDFARAYVIAHEVGHHVQNLLGITDKADNAEQHAAGRTGANHVSVEVELQADCFAGVWAAQANAARKILEPGDLEQGLKAASSVGDDTLQKREQGTVVPDSFTHGTSAQRVGWFRRGFDAGKIDACDTFKTGGAL